MSLIERAVSRLNEGRTGTSSASGQSADDSSRTQQRSTIEALADRLAAEGQTSGSREPSHSLVTDTPAAPREAFDAVGSAETVCIDIEGLRARGMVVPSGPRTQSAQEYRVIKRPLLANAFGRGGHAPVRHGKRIMVTSAFPGEGKSFTSINLAMSIAAERGHGVILIDADVARPALPRELGVDVRSGMMDWLIDGAPDVSQLILPTNVDTLSLLPSGRSDEHATEWLASDAMGRLLDLLSERYPDCVLIFDSPPILVTTEARVLASYMGQIVMVVEAGRTPREAVTQALAAIESNEIVGLVLNKVNDVESSGYYPGYGYGYGAT